MKMEKKRKKIISYLHPDIYPQDELTQKFVESLPTQTRGEFYRQAIICGAALSSVDPRLVNLISGLYNSDIDAENLVKIIEQVTGYKSKTVDIDLIKQFIGNKNDPTEDEVKAEEEILEDKALKNLSMLKK